MTLDPIKTSLVIYFFTSVPLYRDNPNIALNTKTLIMHLANMGTSSLTAFHIKMSVM